MRIGTEPAKNYKKCEIRLFISDVKTAASIWALALRHIRENFHTGAVKVCFKLAPSIDRRLSNSQCIL